MNRQLPELLQEPSLNYQTPPQEILDLVDAPRAPFVQIDRAGKRAIFIHRHPFPSIGDLCNDEWRLAGLRLDPKRYISSRTTYYNRLEVLHLHDSTTHSVQGLPETPRLSHFRWSPCQTKLAFAHCAPTGVEAWYVDMITAQAVRLTGPCLNASLDQPLHWMQDGDGLLIKCLPQERLPLRDPQTVVPQGPTISISDGQKAENRTYQDLLKSRDDAYNFTVLATSEIHYVDLKGQKTPWLQTPGLYRSMMPSPDGNYVLVTAIEPPYSYLVPYTRFPQVTRLYTQAGGLVKTVNQVPLTEDLPKGFMSVRAGRRMMGWRADQPATLAWVEALDGGDAANEVPFRDALYTLDTADLAASPTLLVKTIQRFHTVEWASDELALVHDYWWNTRNTKVYRFQPSRPEAVPQVIIDRNYQDEYNDPGYFLTTRNAYGQAVLETYNNALYLMGAGFSEQGQFPFVDRWDLETAVCTRLYQSTYTNRKEQLYFPTDWSKGDFIVRIEAPTEFPNYYLRNIHQKGDQTLRQVTFFENPFQSLQSVHKEVIQYQRKDGIPLSGTLYLPLGYDLKHPEPKPLILWAYPREYKDSHSAGQVRTNSNEFIYPFYGSMVYWVTQGYVVLDQAAFPIVGQGETEPNDTFLEQLIGNAEAAIDTLADRGYIDRDRVAVGGHSYGAFMTANLLTHSDLFAAGIARSGAYNRSLTPFGFQSEERNYWDAKETYDTMSPFMHAHQMKTPLLLVHGAVDNNSGTYPLQSERYFNALKGLGAPTRLVLLPKESHSYVARESILHLLWEQHQWLEHYVKNKIR